MKIYDFHAHIYPEKIADRAVESVGDFYTIGMVGDGTADGLIENGKAVGITSYVVHSVAVTPKTVSKINDYIAYESARHNEFIGFGTIHAETDNKTEELERIQKLGLCGIKIHPDTQKFNVDDEKMYEVYDFLRENKLPVIAHCGDYRYDFSHPKRVKKVLRDFPGLTFIAAHFGGWSIYDLAYEYLGEENCFVDTSSSFMMTGRRRARELIRMYGAERVLFGSDFPMSTPKDELETFNELWLTEEERELILYKNAERILETGREE